MLNKLEEDNFDDSIGIYFYRHESDESPFIKVGVCCNEPITEQISKIWIDGARSIERRSQFGLERLREELEQVREKAPAYFIFYEMVAEEVAPHVDESNALAHHESEFGASTLSGDLAPRFPVAARLVWHDPAFQEVLNKKFPGGADYP